jgi:hypothetical protein
MGQNTSHAVMAQRVEPHDSLDFFPTPPWATRALCESLGRRHQLRLLNVLEPACGQGHMSSVLCEYFNHVAASDICDYGQEFVEDFLFKDRLLSDWVITNPPFNLAEQFAIHALEKLNASGVALLVRTSFLEGVGRHARLFSRHPPTDIFQFTERVPMHKGRLVKNGSTATSYCWIVWDSVVKDWRPDPSFRWITPCRKRLERASDYEALI